MTVGEISLEILSERNLDAAEVAILRSVGGVVAEDVIVGDGLLSLDYSAVEIVGVEECFASSVASQCIESVLRLLEAVRGGKCRRACVNAGIAL